MIIQNRHLEKALNDLESAYESVPGEDHEYEDHSIALAIIERVLAEALRTKPELLPLVNATDIEPLDYRVKAHVGRVLFVRAQLLYEMDELDFAAQSARLACQAFRETLSFEFDDEDRYVANHLHQLMTREISAIAFQPDEVGESYELLFDYYAEFELFDRAEDMLFHALDLRDQPDALLQRGLEFYDSLATQSTRHLQKRGLPRREVNESRREIIARIEERRSSS